MKWREHNAAGAGIDDSGGRRRRGLDRAPGHAIKPAPTTAQQTSREMTS